MGSGTSEKLSGGVQGVMAGRQRALNSPNGPGINQLVGQVGQNIATRDQMLGGAYPQGQSRPPGLPPGTVSPVRGGDVVGGTANLLQARDMALAGGPHAPGINYLVGNVGQNLAAREVALNSDGNPLNNATQMALGQRGGNPANIGIADLIRLVRQARGVG